VKKRIISWIWLAAVFLIGSCAVSEDKEQSRQVMEQVVTVIPVGRYPHGLVVDEGNNRIYVANMNEGTVTVIDGETNAVVDTFQAGKSTRDVAVNAETGRLYVADLGLYDMESVRVGPLRLYRPEFAMAVLDSQTGATLTNVPVGANPWVVEVNEAAGHIYVANYNSSSVSVIDGAEGRVITTIDVGPFRVPFDIAVDEETNRVYVTVSSQVGPVGTGAGRLLVIDGDTHQVLEELNVGSTGAAPSVAVNERTNRLYVTDRKRDTLLVIDGQTHEVVATLGVGRGPCGLAVNEGTDRVYVANCDGDSVSAIDGETNEVLYEVRVSTLPKFIAVDRATRRVYVTHPAEDIVTVLDANVLE